MSPLCILTFDEFVSMSRAYNQAILENYKIMLEQSGTGTRTRAMADFEFLATLLLRNTKAKDLPEWKYYKESLLAITDSGGINFQGRIEQIPELRNEKSEIYNIVDRKKLIELFQIKSKPNYLSKFIFNFITADFDRIDK